MQLVFNYCKSLLSQKKTGIIFLIIAILAKIAMQLAYFSISDDKSVQLLAAKNLLVGHGLTINRVLLSNLSSEEFIPMVGWPPGYSVILSPLLWLFNNDYKTAALVFDIACVFPFFFYLIRLLNFLSLQIWLKNLFIIFAGFFFYPADSHTCTDFVSLCCMLAGLYYLLMFMQKDKAPLSLVFAVSISFFLAGFFRYNYIPVVLCCPILLGVAGFINKRKLWIKGSFQTGLILGVLLFGLLLFQNYNTGSAGYINTRETGFFPENLLKMHPVVGGSFFDIDVHLKLFTNFVGGSSKANERYFEYINYLLFILLVVYGIRWLIKNKLQLKTNTAHFSFMGFSISVAIIFLLFFLSVRNSSILSLNSSPWTYVQEARYFAFIVVFIQLIVFSCLFNRFAQLSRFWKRVALFCAFVLIVQFVHKVYYVSLFWMRSNPPFYSSAMFTIKTESITRLFKTAQNQHPSYEIIVASPDYNTCNYASLENIKAVYLPSPFSLSQQISFVTPAKLLIVLPAKLVPDYDALLKSGSIHYFGEVQNLYFYTLDVSTRKR